MVNQMMVFLPPNKTRVDLCSRGHWSRCLPFNPNFLCRCLHFFTRMSASCELALTTHPFGVCPLGNAYFNNEKNPRPDLLGSLARFEDAFLVQFLIDWLDVRTMLHLSAASRYLYALVNTPRVWREKYIREKGGNIFKWPGSWRGVYAASETDSAARIDAAVACRVKLTNIYSDTIYHDFITASFDALSFIEEYTRRESRRLMRARKIATDTVPERPKIPDNFERIDATTCTLSTFVTRFAQTNQPCIILNATKGWPSHAWTFDYLRNVWAKRTFQAEALRIDGKTYVEYARSFGGGGMPDPTSGVVPDTSPFYLFDSDVGADTAGGATGWRVPSLIAQYPLDEQALSDKSMRVAEERTRADLFSLFGDARPDYRWLIAGPARSGSCWHKDPNLTSAWNAVMQGSKYWMMLPPKTVPPGVYVTEDESEVTAPASLSEWMLDFYVETKKKHGRRECGGDGQLIEGVCRAGEVMYVPSGWWHLVVNLDESVALTQNFVSVTELPAVLSFMKYTPEQISGFREDVPKSSVFEQFVDKLRAYDARLAEDALQRMHLRKRCKSVKVDERSWRERLCSTTDTACSFSALVQEDELGEMPW